MAKPPFNLPDAASVARSKSPVSLSELTPSDRLKHHQQVMRSIGFNRGLDGVKEYRAKHPEAMSVLVKIASSAFTPKPQGYDQYLVDLVRTWITDYTALANTNIADVKRLNTHFNTKRFNPAKHFSEPLSKGRLAQLKAVFDENGLSLDTEKANTLSRVKEAAKAVKGLRSANRRVGKFGVIAGDKLVIGNQTFSLSHNGSRECIRVRINGNIRRMYLDEIEWLADLLADAANDPLSDYYLCNIGECDYLPDQPGSGPKSALETVEISDCDYSETRETSDCDYSEQSPRSLTDITTSARAGLASEQPYSPTCPDGVDPLTLP